MRRVVFHAYGHVNVKGNHRTTAELTSEDFLTTKGDCILGIRSDLTLDSLDDEIKTLARSKNTKITLRIAIGNLSDEITGHGSPGLTYEDSTSMVARTSNYECGRTLMIEADKAASDINRDLITKLQNPDAIVECELLFITQ